MSGDPFKDKLVDFVAQRRAQGRTKTPEQLARTAQMEAAVKKLSHYKPISMPTTGTPQKPGVPDYKTPDMSTATGKMSHLLTTDFDHLDNARVLTNHADRVRAVTRKNPLQAVTSSVNNAVRGTGAAALTGITDLHTWAGKHPFEAATIGVGTAAIVGGVAYGIYKLVQARQRTREQQFNDKQRLLKTAPQAPSANIKGPVPLEPVSDGVGATA